MTDPFVPPAPPLRVAVFDYRAGNLHSLVKALETPFTDVRVEPDPVAAAREADVLVLPGVGAFTPAAEALAPGRDAMRE
jgi:glutamine amidotransferase